MRKFEVYVSPLLDGWIARILYADTGMIAHVVGTYSTSLAARHAANLWISQNGKEASNARD